MIADCGYHVYCQMKKWYGDLKHGLRPKVQVHAKTRYEVVHDGHDIERNEIIERTKPTRMEKVAMNRAIPRNLV